MFFSGKYLLFFTVTLEKRNSWKISLPRYSSIYPKIMLWWNYKLGMCVLYSVYVLQSTTNKIIYRYIQVCYLLHFHKHTIISCEKQIITVQRICLKYLNFKLFAPSEITWLIFIIIQKSSWQLSCKRPITTATRENHLKCLKFLC